MSNLNNIFIAHMMIPTKGIIEVLVVHVILQKRNKIIRMEKFSLKKSRNIWDKVFKNGPSKICGRQPLKN